MTLLMIDPGHGGNDSGATSGSYKEKDFTLHIALSVRDYLLSKYQVNIVMTRTTDITVSLRERTDFANEKKADYFCAIHINAGGGEGYESYIYSGSVPTQSIQNQAVIHNTVIDTIGKKYSVVDRGKKRANFAVLRETIMPAVLFENLFIDNPKDLDLLRNPLFIADLVQGLGEGLAHALDLPVIILYRVIAGSFKDKQSALDRQKLLSSKGIESIIVDNVVSNEKMFRVQVGAYHDRLNAEKLLEELKKIGIPDASIIS